MSMSKRPSKPISQTWRLYISCHLDHLDKTIWIPAGARVLKPKANLKFWWFVINWTINDKFSDELEPSKVNIEAKIVLSEWLRKETVSSCWNNVNLSEDQHHLLRRYARIDNCRQIHKFPEISKSYCIWPEMEPENMKWIYHPGWMRKCQLVVVYNSVLIIVYVGFSLFMLIY